MYAHDPGTSGEGGLGDMPHEVLAVLFNGHDENGRPLLDPRYRFVIRATCRLWHGVIRRPTAEETECIIARTMDGRYNRCLLSHSPPVKLVRARRMCARGTIAYVGAIAHIIGSAVRAGDNNDDDGNIDAIAQRMADVEKAFVPRLRRVLLAPAVGCLDRYGVSQRVQREILRRTMMDGECTYGPLQRECGISSERMGALMCHVDPMTLFYCRLPNAGPKQLRKNAPAKRRDQSGAFAVKQRLGWEDSGCSMLIGARCCRLARLHSYSFYAAVLGALGHTEAMIELLNGATSEYGDDDSLRIVHLQVCANVAVSLDRPHMVDALLDHCASRGGNAVRLLQRVNPWSDAAEACATGVIALLMRIRDSQSPCPACRTPGQLSRPIPEHAVAITAASDALDEPFISDSATSTAAFNEDVLHNSTSLVALDENDHATGTDPHARSSANNLNSNVGNGSAPWGPTGRENAMGRLANGAGSSFDGLCTRCTNGWGAISVRLDITCTYDNYQWIVSAGSMGMTPVLGACRASRYCATQAARVAAFHGYVDVCRRLHAPQDAEVQAQSPANVDSLALVFYAVKGHEEGYDTKEVLDWIARDRTHVLALREITTMVMKPGVTYALIRHPSLIISRWPEAFAQPGVDATDAKGRPTDAQSIVSHLLRMAPCSHEALREAETIMEIMRPHMSRDNASLWGVCVDILARPSRIHKKVLYRISTSVAILCTIARRCGVLTDNQRGRLANAYDLSRDAPFAEAGVGCGTRIHTICRRDERERIALWRHWAASMRPLERRLIDACLAMPSLRLYRGTPQYQDLVAAFDVLAEICMTPK